MSDALQVGSTYDVTSNRKGRFTARLDGQDDTWAHLTITDGRADAMLAENACEAGEPVTVRKSFCTFKQVATP